MKKISVLTTMIILIIFIAQASATTSYKIKKGDNLYTLARKFHVNLKDIESANKNSAKVLKPGMKIVIPVKEKSSKTLRITKNKTQKEKAVIASVTKPSRHGKPESVASGKQQMPNVAAEESLRPAKATVEIDKFHIVRKGDTLGSVAKMYGLTETDIRDMNNLAKTKLKAGRKLLVRRAGPRTYMVRKGDNLWQIARKFDMATDDLMEINEMTTPSLKVGQKLYLENRPDLVNVDQKYIVMAKSIEEELIKVPDSPEFAEKNSQDKLALFAKKLINIPYKFGGNTILGIDCSAYVKKVYGLMGVNLPRTAREQFREGQEINKEQLSVGDLVFFRTYASFPSHVGIYIGNDLFIHASSKGKKVTIDSLETPYYLKRFIGAKRLISASDKDEGSYIDPS
jgi:LysM repeat protein